MRRSSRKLAEGVQDFRNFRDLLQFVDLRPGNLSVLVRDEDSTVIHKRELVFRRGKNSVSLRCLRVRPAVRGQRKPQSPQGLLECDVRKDCIGIDAQNLGVIAGKLGKFSFDCRQFVLSNRGEIESVKEDNDVLSPVTRKLELTLCFAGDARQLEVWSRIAYFQRHEDPPL